MPSEIRDQIAECGRMVEFNAYWAARAEAAGDLSSAADRYEAAEFWSSMAFDLAVSP